MRFLFPVAIAFSAAALAQPAAAPVPPSQPPSALAVSDCPEEKRYFAHRDGRWLDKPLGPQKLGDLPPAETFAAVYRRDERGCILFVKYRDVRR